MRDRDQVIHAAMRGRSALAALVAQDHALIDERSGTGETAFLYLAIENDLAAVKALLDCGADVNAVDDHGETALAHAVGQRYLELIGELLHRGADLNAGKRLPLQIAIERDHRDIARTLLDAGARIETPDDSGEALLNVAIAESHYDMAELLIARRADVNVRGLWGETPLHVTARMGSVRTCKSLIAAGASLTARNDRGLTPREIAAEYYSGYVVEAFTPLGQTGT